MASPGLRQRVVRGAQAQAFGHVVKMIVQVGGIGVLVATWGLDLYGEWLILAAIPIYLTFSDIGLFAAASNEMIMDVQRGARDRALGVFQAVSRFVAYLSVSLAVALPLLAAVLPVASLLNLNTIDELTAAWVVVALGLNTVLMTYAGLLYGGFAAEGRYGEAGIAVAGIILLEFCALAGVVLAGGGPAPAATGMLLARVIGTAAMLAWMKRFSPWLHFGRPEGMSRILRQLLTPALASGSFPAALALNVQGMVILVGVALSPASAAIFSTLRTMSRAVIQLLGSIFAVVSPEISRAYAREDPALLKTLHRRACQVAIWMALPIVVVLAAFGDPIVSAWTSGKVSAEGALLYLFLGIVALDTLWYTSLAVLFATNRHQRAAVHYLVASVLSLPLAYVLLQAWGLEGAALALVLLEGSMLVAVLHQALPAVDESLRGWLASLLRPPGFLLRRERPQPEGDPRREMLAEQPPFLD